MRLLEAAAERIEELEAEVAALKGERDRLRGALESVEADAGHSDSCPISWKSNESECGCFQRDVRAALEGK